MPTMFDTTNVAAIPASAGEPDYAAGYVDGRWPTFAAMAARYTQAVPVSISAIPSSSQARSADVCDCEEGDYTPSQAAAWAQARIAANRQPCIYCSLSEWAACQGAVEALGITVDQVDWWIAAYPGSGPAVYPGAVAHQYVDRGTYDESVVVAGWQPGRAIFQPSPGQPPVNYPEDAMTRVYVPLFKCDANGWYAEGVPGIPGWPAGKTTDDIVSVVPKWASAYDPQSWQACAGSIDYTGDRIVFHGTPNGEFDAYVWVTD
jgi:hypothetical protein